ncbi:MAG: VCBS repeat-containing protein [Betaproteobacteria bacterium]|nr:VCBS repeat-containing protein [Betaproteobacteria bacterium]
MVSMAQPDGSFSEQAAQLFSGPVTAAIMFAQVRVGDVNGDGLLDIFVPDGGLDIGDNGGSTPKLALGTPTGFVDASARFAGMPTTRAHNGVLADIDRNGTLDAFVGGTSDGPKNKLPFLLLNDGTTATRTSPIRSPGCPRSSPTRRSSGCGSGRSAPARRGWRRSGSRDRCSPTSTATAIPT